MVVGSRTCVSWVGCSSIVCVLVRDSSRRDFKCLVDAGASCGSLECGISGGSCCTGDRDGG